MHSRGERVRAWRAAFEQGFSDEACNRIVRTRPVPPRLLAALAITEEPPELTPRQLQVVSHLATCCPTRQAVADHMGISVNTVRRHLLVSLRRTELHSIAQLVAYCISRGYIDIRA